jgi:hypothetical protein
MITDRSFYDGDREPRDVTVVIDRHDRLWRHGEDGLWRWRSQRAQERPWDAHPWDEQARLWQWVLHDHGPLTEVNERGDE